MQTSFSLAQLADSQVAESEKILRTCVHCGFCQATCPTYLLLGDELDSPRGRIYLIKDMLENDRPATADVVKHIDRCLSCLACMTTCPSGVHYMHLIDHARVRIEKTYRRPSVDRWVRSALAWVLPNNARFRWALRAAVIGRAFAPLLVALGLKRLAAALRLAPARLPRRSASEGRRLIPAQGARKGRVALVPGCVTPVVGPAILDATIRVLTRHGIDVVLPEGQGCCGGLVHHMGQEAAAHDAACRNVSAWTFELGGEGLDAIVLTASGCGTTVKDYGFMLRNDPAFAVAAERVSGLAVDICEYLDRAGLLPTAAPNGLTVAYHAACSLQHGQKITREPKELLSKLGFVVKDVPEAHLCCGSAGTYNILQPDIAGRLRQRKVGNIEKVKPDVIAAGNIGCISQIAAGTAIPIVHPVELIDWATGGPQPAALQGKFKRKGIAAASAKAAETAI
ncbi:MAG: glycolate oxidase iron-sulfur subunit [Alphaproteobacteria bacterium]|jgi:glycolate oxidase iron-sulfur subunit|nr:glycolate oxidase iron-sulfur subunit [Alphaproteobacteria bacterium]